MQRIFDPISQNALIYIDDILLFSKTADEHRNLLSHFYSLCIQYGIMLSHKKMILAAPEIEFLGMKIANSSFQLQPHIANELLTFPEENLSKVQVQQFLGILTYASDFIQNLSEIIHPLRLMLRKNPPSWSPAQTHAIQKIKQLIPSLPPLQIPSDGIRILQTDASDTYWGAILLEQKDGQIRVCAYKGGRFSDPQLHYHSTLKEIIAVKKGIEKFQFHLIGHHFIVQSDMKAFPQMLNFKNKTIPPPQLLRLKEWFSQFDFTVQHIPDKENTLADFLS